MERKHGFEREPQLVLSDETRFEIRKVAQSLPTQEQIDQEIGVKKMNKKCDREREKQEEIQKGQ